MGHAFRDQPWIRQTVVVFSFAIPLFCPWRFGHGYHDDTFVFCLFSFLLDVFHHVDAFSIISRTRSSGDEPPGTPPASLWVQQVLLVCCLMVLMFSMRRVSPQARLASLLPSLLPFDAHLHPLHVQSAFSTPIIAVCLGEVFTAVLALPESCV